MIRRPCLAVTRYLDKPCWSITGVMTTLGLLLLFAGSVGGAGIHDALTKGLCLCVADNDIYARDGRKSQSVT